MNLSARKTELVQAIVPLILRNGIRAIRIDDIAGTLGISKRTIYKMFHTKTELIQTSLQEIVRRFAQKSPRYATDSTASPITRLWIQALEYLRILYTGERTFWYDLKYLSGYQDIYTAIRKHWITGIEEKLVSCREKEYLIPDTDISLFSKTLQHTVYERCLDRHSYPDQFTFIYILIRGIASDSGLTELNAVEKNRSFENDRQKLFSSLSNAAEKNSGWK